MLWFYLPIILLVPAIVLVWCAALLIRQGITKRRQHRNWRQRGFPLHDVAPTPVEPLGDDYYPGA